MTALELSDRFQSQYAAFETYVRGGFLPLWCNAGWSEKDRCCFERLDTDGLIPFRDWRRSMTLGRMLFVYSEAHRLWGDDCYKARAEQTYEYLLDRFWDKSNGGWYFTVSRSGAPLNRGKDLYAHAFVMFGLAHYYNAFQCAEALNLVHETQKLLTKCLLLRKGWMAPVADEEWRILDRSLTQNPQMHLFETYIYLQRFTGDPNWKQEIERIADVAANILWEDGSGVIREYLDAHGKPDRAKGHIIEPGHQLEWAWLLQEASDIVPLDARILALCDKLYDWSVRFGIDHEHGGIFDRVDPTGVVIADTKRIWPVTECIKALTTRVALRKENDSSLSDWIKFLVGTYLRPDGTWLEYVNRDLSPKPWFLPASTGYHTFMAYLAVRRLALNKDYGIRNEPGS